MGHNTTSQAAASYVRTQQLGSYADWNLVTRCDHCLRETILRIDSLAPHWLAGSVSTALTRLRCRACGKFPSTVRLERGKRSVVLIGPGVYG